MTWLHISDYACNVTTLVSAAVRYEAQESINRRQRSNRSERKYAPSTPPTVCASAAYAIFRGLTAHGGPGRFEVGSGHAGGRIRTADPRITNALLYRLSYTGCGSCSGGTLSFLFAALPIVISTAETAFL